MTLPPLPEDPFAPPPMSEPGAGSPLGLALPPPAAYPPGAAYPPEAYATTPSAYPAPADYFAASRVANTSATIAFVLALLGLVLTPVVDIAAVIVGHHALSTIRRTGEAGAGLAKAALAIGYSLMGIGALVIAFVGAMLFGSIAQ